MTKYAIVLTLYDENDEEKRTYSRSFVPFRLLKNAVRMAKFAEFGNDISKFDEEMINEIADFVVDFFGNKFSREELLESADVSEVIATMTAIMTKIKGSGSLDPTLPA